MLCVGREFLCLMLSLLKKKRPHNPAWAVFLKAHGLVWGFWLVGFVCLCNHIKVAHIPFVGKVPSVKGTPSQLQAV